MYGLLVGDTRGLKGEKGLHVSGKRLVGEGETGRKRDRADRNRLKSSDQEGLIRVGHLGCESKDKAWLARPATARDRKFLRQPRRVNVSRNSWKPAGEKSNEASRGFRRFRGPYLDRYRPPRYYLVYYAAGRSITSV